MPVIYLPAYYFSRYLPFFSKMRVMMRFGLFTLIFSSLLAGLGAYLLTKSASSKVKRWVGVTLLVLIFIDFYPGVLKDFRPTQVRPVDNWLAAQSNTGAMAQFPFNEESSQGLVYDTLVNQKPFLGGYFNANSPEQYSRIFPVMNTFPSQKSVSLLTQMGVTYVVVDSSQYRNFLDIDQKIQFSSLGFAAISFMACKITSGIIPTPMSDQTIPNNFFIADIMDQIKRFLVIQRPCCWFCWRCRAFQSQS